MISVFQEVQIAHVKTDRQTRNGFVGLWRCYCGSGWFIECSRSREAAEVCRELGISVRSVYWAGSGVILQTKEKPQRMDLEAARRKEESFSSVCSEDLVKCRG